MIWLGDLGVMLLLICVNAFYVAAEFAMIASPQLSLEAVAEKNKWAANMLAIKSDSAKQDIYLAVVQVGVTFASLALGMFSEKAIAEFLITLLVDANWELSATVIHVVSSALSLLILTYIHVVLGEMVPKSMAIVRPLVWARLVELPMRISTYVLYPLVRFLNACGNVILRVLGMPISKDMSAAYSTEELDILFDEGSEQNVITDNCCSMVKRLLGLGERTIGDVMVPRIKVVGISQEMGLKEALEQVYREGYSRYPVYEGDLDHIQGFVHVRDMYLAMRAGGDFKGWASIQRECPKFPESLHLERAMEVMRGTRGHMAAVVDEHGGIAGIITMEDLIEEIVGEVYDEFDDTEQVPIEPLQDEPASWLVSGSVLLEDLGEVLDCDLSNDEVETVGGLVMDRLGRLPEVGDSVTYQGVEITVTEMADMVPERCKVSIIPTRDEAGEGKQ